MILKTPRMINAGHFNKRIEIEVYKGDFNENGMWVKDWFPFTKAMAFVQVRQLKEISENDVQTREGYTEMTIRQNKQTMAIETGMRVKQKVFGQELLYKVDDIDYRPNDNKYMTLKCIKE